MPEVKISREVVVDFAEDIIHEGRKLQEAKNYGIRTLKHKNKVTTIILVKIAFYRAQRTINIAHKAPSGPFCESILIYKR